MSRIPYPGPFGPNRGYSAGQPLDYESAQNAVAIGRFFNAVYGWMAAGLALTAVVAWWLSTQRALVESVFTWPVLIVLFIAQLGLVFTVSAAVNRLSAGVATALFLLYAAINGVLFASLFWVYAHGVIAGAFVTSAATFGAMSVYGFTTRRDLSGWGSYLMMGLIGVVIASFVSIFWHNTVLTVLINYLGVFLFIALTAYDTQKLRYIAVQTSGNAALSARWAISGALTLYLDFINLFLFILNLLGDRRR